MMQHHAASHAMKKRDSLSAELSLNATPALATAGYGETGLASCESLSLATAGLAPQRSTSSCATLSEGLSAAGTAGSHYRRAGSSLSAGDTDIMQLRAEVSGLRELSQRLCSALTDIEERLTPSAGASSGVGKVGEEDLEPAFVEEAAAATAGAGVGARSRAAPLPHFEGKVPTKKPLWA